MNPASGLFQAGLQPSEKLGIGSLSKPGQALPVPSLTKNI